MSKFSDFMIAYTEMCQKKNLQINPRNSKEYGWKIGVNAKNAFEDHLDEQTTAQFDAETIERFKNMFTKDNEMMAINVISNPSGARANKVYLYHVKPKQGSDTIKDVMFNGTKVLKSRPTFPDPQGGNITWKYGLQSNCITIKDSKNVYVDEAGKGKGTFSGEENDVSVNGTVDYQSGEIVIHRMSKKNEKLVMKFQNDYNMVIDVQTSSLTSSSSSGSSGGGGGSIAGGSSSSSSSSTQSVGEALNLKHDYYDKDDFQINYTYFDKPLKLVWEYDITESEEE